MARRTKRQHGGGARDWRALETDQAGGLWQLMSRGLALVVILGLIAVGSVMIWPEILREHTLDDELTALRTQRDQVAARRDRVLGEIKLIEHNALFFEMVARDALDLHREGERVIRIKRDLPSDAGEDASAAPVKAGN